jgi:branched-chain amino acid aminotransferase
MGFSGTGTIWMNGKMVEWKDATIHIASHVVHYGSGVFEGARCYATSRGSAVFRLDDHLIRLINSAKIYRMEYPLDLAGWRSAVLDTIRANALKACYIRPIVYRGYETLGVNPLNNPVDAAIMVWEWGAYLGPEAIEQGVEMKISSWSRMAPNTLPAMAKATANYANSALIKMEALLDGYSEGIALDVFGNVSEGSGQNIFVVKNGTILTPPVSASILSGITRDSIITLARKLGYPVAETNLPREALYIADEVFVVGTAAEVTPIRSIDKITIGSGRRGAITAALQRAFFDVVNANVSDEHGWLTYVYPQEGAPGNAKAAAEAGARR